MTLLVPGTPTPKGRPRFTRSGRTYTDARTKSAEDAVRSAWLDVAGSRKPHDGPVWVEFTATFEPPKSWPKWKREAALAGELPHTTKPDMDNLVKVIDGLNGWAWFDDSQAFRVGALKQYGPEASTRIAITFLPAVTNPNPKGN